MLFDLTLFHNNFALSCLFLQLFLLEESRDRKFDSYARIIQKAFRAYKGRKDALLRREEGEFVRWQFLLGQRTGSVVQLPCFCFAALEFV